MDPEAHPAHHRKAIVGALTAPGGRDLRHGRLRIHHSSGQENLMPTLVISIDLPPTGELETSGNGWSGPPTDAQMAEETQARQNFLGLRLRQRRNV
jgi:hypothetical protein